MHCTQFQLFYLSVSQHPVCHVPQSLPERDTGVVGKEVCRCAVADSHVGAGPHHGRRLVAGVQRREPEGLRLAPPHRVGVVADVEVLVADGVVHVAGQDTVRLSV